MAIELNHIIVYAKDAKASAKFLADILGLEVGDKWGPFYPLVVSNGVTLDYFDTTGDIQSQHCAFLVSDDEFDASFERIKAAGIPYWADPYKQKPNEINHMYGGRGFYFDDPDGHAMELLTAPYA